MSMSSSNLASALLVTNRALSPAELTKFKDDWRRRYIGRDGVAILEPGYDLETILRNAQNRFKAPHLRDYGYRMPVPFRWGPNGSLILLATMLAAYAVAVGVVLILRGIE